MSLLVLFDTGDGSSEAAELNILDINVYAKNLIHISFEDEIVVNDLYNDPANYSLSPYPGGGSLEVLSVLQTNGTSSLELILVTQPMTAGTTYQLDITEVVDRNNFGFAFSALFDARYTKLDSALRSIPAHYDKRSSSLLHALLTAVSTSDDIIGGSRSDSYTYS